MGEGGAQSAPGEGFLPVLLPQPHARQIATDAIDYVKSLRLIGGAVLYGYNDSGRAILAVASAAEERLDALKKIWNRIHAAGQRSVPDKRPRKHA